MMKKMTAVLMTLIMILSICACGASGTGTEAPSDGKEAANAADSANVSKDTGTEQTDSQEKGGQNTDKGNQETESTETSKADASEEDDLQAEMDELSAIGDVEVENGILTVSVTVPAKLAGEVTQEGLDAGKGEYYQSAVLNSDGSVTYKMTKKQHRAKLDALAGSFDESAQKLINDKENYTITDVSHNQDFTEFNVTLSGTEIGFGDSFASYSFYTYGSLYGIYSGHTPEHMIVNFYGSDGNLIQSFDSADTQN